MISALFVWTYYCKHIKGFETTWSYNKKTLIRILNMLIYMVLISSSIILLPCICIARILESRHYFGDVVFAVVQVGLFGFLW